MDGSLLVESADNVVRLLHLQKYNQLPSKSIRKLTCLYKVLKDFLPEDVRQEPAKCKGTSDLVYQCGVCNGVITLYNGDLDLSMDLHCQEDEHQGVSSAGKQSEANKKEDDRNVIVSDGCNNLYCALCGTQVDDVPSHTCQQMSAALWLRHKSFFSSPEPGRLKCVLCQFHVYPGHTAHDHLVGKRHPKRVANKFLRTCGERLHCALCNVTFQPGDNVVEHLEGETHCGNLAEQQEETWLQVPQQYRHHWVHFSNYKDGVLQCTLCGAIVKQDARCLVQHVRGSRHSRQVANISVPCHNWAE